MLPDDQDKLASNAINDAHSLSCFHYHRKNAISLPLQIKAINFYPLLLSSPCRTFTDTGLGVGCKRKTSKVAGPLHGC